MSLFPTIYSSDDPGAPQLSGTVGSLISVLRAVLVTGYGTAPNDQPGLGWTEEFTDVNKAVFRNSAISGSGSYLRVDDTGAGAGGAREALVRAFESMSDVDTGVGPAPKVSDLANGLVWIKSITANATTRPWRIIGTERDLYLFLGASGAGGYASFGALDLRSRVVGDRYNFTVFGSRNFMTAGYLNAGFWVDGGLESTVTSSPSVFILRPHTGAVGAVGMAWIAPSANTSASIFGNGGLTYPDTVSGGLVAEPVSLREAQRIWRGDMPGVYAPLHDLTLGEGFYDYLLPSIDSAYVMPVQAYLGNLTEQYLGRAIFDMSSEWL